MGFEESKQAIAQIYRTGRTSIAGTGFLVADRYVLTCAHVVRSALAGENQPVGATIEMQFPLQQSRAGAVHTAKVIFYDFEAEREGKDAALLYLTSPQLPSVPVTPLKFLGRCCNGAEIRAFGFLGGESSGRNLTAITEGSINGGWVQLRAPGETGVAVEDGASGSPVWCDAVDAFVGMVVAKDGHRVMARLGFLIPTEHLQAPLQALARHSLQQLLAPHWPTLQDPILRAYQASRPETWSRPRQSDLEGMLSDLSQMPAGGLDESRLVQFAAYLLNQPEINDLRIPLTCWIEPYTSNLSALLAEMKTREAASPDPAVAVTQPCLMISVQADKTKQAAPYQVRAWLIRNPDVYNPDTSDGAAELTPNFEGYTDEAGQPVAIDLNEGVRRQDLQFLLAAYLDQVGCEIEQKDLVIELILPLALINEPLEQTQIPDTLGLLTPLGVNAMCSHVVVRSQKRLTYTRSFTTWKSKWDRIFRERANPAAPVFVQGQANLQQLRNALNSALGLKLSGPLQTTQQGEVNYLIATGTPVALWVRSRSAATDWGALLDTQVLNGCLEELPGAVLTLRRETAALETDAEREKSQELGHHLSFMWENPYCVPPRMPYTDEALR